MSEGIWHSKKSPSQTSHLRQHRPFDWLGALFFLGKKNGGFPGTSKSTGVVELSRNKTENPMAFWYVFVWVHNSRTSWSFLAFGVWSPWNASLAWMVWTYSRFYSNSDHITVWSLGTPETVLRGTGSRVLAVLWAIVIRFASWCRTMILLQNGCLFSESFLIQQRLSPARILRVFSWGTGKCHPALGFGGCLHAAW